MLHAGAAQPALSTRAVQPVVLTSPMPFEANAGVFSGRAPQGTQTIRVLVNGRRLDRVALRPGRRAFSFGPTGLPLHDVTIQVRFLRGGKLLGSRVVHPVFGLPKASWKVAAPRRTDPVAQRALRGSSSAPGVSSAVWAAGLAPGSSAASWNAGSLFTGASTLKLAILMCTFAHDESDPVTSGWFSTYQSMILDSSNTAADAVLTHLGGSTSGGASIVDSCVRTLGATNTIMYGGYETDAYIPPVGAEDPPSISYGKHTTAHDLGTLLLDLVRASSGTGPAHTIGLTERKARVALWLLVHARYPGLVRPWTVSPVAHKAGWLGEVQHDASLIFTPRGTLILVVMTERSSGVSYTDSERYGGRVVRLVLRRLLPG
jgi:beta-lactamase class A